MAIKNFIFPSVAAGRRPDNEQTRHVQRQISRHQDAGPVGNDEQLAPISFIVSNTQNARPVGPVIKPIKRIGRINTAAMRRNATLKDASTHLNLGLKDKTEQGKEI